MSWPMDQAPGLILDPRLDLGTEAIQRADRLPSAFRHRPAVRDQIVIAVESPVKDARQFGKQPISEGEILAAKERLRRHDWVQSGGQCARRVGDLRERVADDHYPAVQSDIVELFAVFSIDVDRIASRDCEQDLRDAREIQPTPNASVRDDRDRSTGKRRETETRINKVAQRWAAYVAITKQRADHRTDQTFPRASRSNEQGDLVAGRVAGNQPSECLMDESDRLAIDAVVSMVLIGEDFLQKSVPTSRHIACGSYETAAPAVAKSLGSGEWSFRVGRQNEAIVDRRASAGLVRRIRITRTGRSVAGAIQSTTAPIASATSDTRCDRPQYARSWASLFSRRRS